MIVYYTSGFAEVFIPNLWMTVWKFGSSTMVVQLSGFGPTNVLLYSLLFIPYLIQIALRVHWLVFVCFWFVWFKELFCLLYVQVF